MGKENSKLKTITGNLFRITTGKEVFFHFTCPLLFSSFHQEIENVRKGREVNERSSNSFAAAAQSISVLAPGRLR